jgi:hypothetical protein
MLLVLAVFEFPLIYMCCTQCNDFKEKALNSLYLKNYAVKGVLYILLSIITYFHSTICVIAGILLDLTALLLFFAELNKRNDSSDYMPGSVDEQKSSESSIFGTF